VAAGGLEEQQRQEGGIVGEMEGIEMLRQEEQGGQQEELDKRAIEEQLKGEDEDYYDTSDEDDKDA
jgi:hypothetical protein